MTTLYRFQWQFTKSKVGTTPANAPTVKIADRNNNLLVNGSAATALSNLAGVYKYDYTGADDLDLIAICNTADTTVDQQDLPSYTPYAVHVLTPEIKAVTDKLETLLQVSGLVYQFTADALENAPAATATVSISAAVAASVASGRLALRSDHTWRQTITSTSTDDLSSAKIWLAIKTSADQTDAQSLVFIDTTTGLVYLYGNSSPTANQGSITIGGVSGAWEINLYLDEASTDYLRGLAVNTYVAEIKYRLNGDNRNAWDGYADIYAGIVRALS